MIVREILTGKERIAFVATESLVCWICGHTIPQGQQYTRHPLPTVKTVSYPACRMCYKFQPVDPITDRIAAVASQETTIMPALSEQNTMIMPAVSPHMMQTELVPTPMALERETPPLVPAVLRKAHRTLKKIVLRRFINA